MRLLAHVRCSAIQFELASFLHGSQSVYPHDLFVLEFSFATQQKPSNVLLDEIPDRRDGIAEVCFVLYYSSLLSTSLGSAGYTVRFSC